MPPPPSPAHNTRRPGRLGTLALLAIVTAVLFAYDGNRRLPTGAADGTPAATRAAPTPARLRIATFNIASGRGTDGRLDLARTRAAMAAADLVALHEVRGAAQAADLGALFAPTEQRWWRDDFGNALTARVPLTRWARIPLPGTQTRGHRNAILAVVPLGRGSLRLLATHIDRRDDQTAQLHYITTLFLALEPPAILVGDLNVHRDDPRLADLRAAATDATAGFGAAGAPARIELIFSRGLRTLDAGTIDNGASDHPLVWVDVEPTGEAK